MITDERLAVLTTGAVVSVDEVLAMAQELQERRATTLPCTQWQITVPGYEYNPDGRDYYPDEIEVFDGTEAELHAHILEKETEYQAARLLRRQSVQPALWKLVEPQGEAGACKEWCRGVEGIVGQPPPRRDTDYGAVVKAATQAAPARVAAILAHGEDVLARRAVEAAAKAEAAERAELARLQAKYA